MIDPKLISERITAAIPNAEVHVTDLTGGADHFQVEVVSPAFAGISPVQRHRMVYGSLRDVLGGDLHALALSTKTPQEVG